MWRPRQPKPFRPAAYGVLPVASAGTSARCRPGVFQLAPIQVSVAGRQVAAPTSKTCSLVDTFHFCYINRNLHFFRGGRAKINRPEKIYKGNAGAASCRPYDCSCVVYGIKSHEDIICPYNILCLPVQYYTPIIYGII